MSTRTCLKCGHINPKADGGYLEACPQCGAIYTKVERALAARRAEEPPADATPARRVAAGAVGAARKPKRNEWMVGLLLALLLVLVPMWIYQEVWGVTAKQRRSKSTNAAMREADRPVVSNSGWDGSVHQVERYLKRNLKDPSSLNVIEWGNVVPGADGGFVVRVKYRAKNSFGGYVVEDQVFSLDAQGNVIGAVNL